MPTKWREMLEGKTPTRTEGAEVAFVAPNTQLGIMLGVGGGHSHHGGVIPGSANGKKGSLGIE